MLDPPINCSQKIKQGNFPLLTIVRVSAPGKVILHGEHSVVYNKLALAASLGLRTRLTIDEIQPSPKKRPDDSGTIDLQMSSLNLQHVYTLEQIRSFLFDHDLPLHKSASHYTYTAPDLIDHNRLVEQVAHFVKGRSGFGLGPKHYQALVSFFYLFHAFLGCVDFDLRPFKIVITSDLTLGAGTGSSASYSVCVAAGLLQLVRTIGKGPRNGFKKPSQVHCQPSAHFSPDDLELISKWAFQAEKIIHGTPSGVDNTVCTYGSMVEFRKGTQPKLIDLKTSFSLILIDTKVARETKVLVQKVATLREKHSSVIDGVLELMDETAAEALKYIRRINGGGSGDEFEALVNYERLGDLSVINHNLLRALGVSHQKLDEVCDILGERGLQGKLTGAGGGGFAICLVPPTFEMEDIEEVIEKLKSKGFDALLTSLGGKGVAVD